MKKKIKLIPLLYSNHSSSVGLYDIVFFLSYRPTEDELLKKRFGL